MPDDVKRRRNNALLAVQGRISAQVHREWEGREVDVFVERISARAASRGRESRAAKGVELRWERHGEPKSRPGAHPSARRALGGGRETEDVSGQAQDQADRRLADRRGRRRTP